MFAKVRTSHLQHKEDSMLATVKGPRQGSPSLRSSPPARTAPHSPTPTRRSPSHFYADLPHPPLAQSTSLTTSTTTTPSLLKVAQQQHASYDETQRPLEGSAATAKLLEGAPDGNTGPQNTSSMLPGSPVLGNQDGVCQLRERPLSTATSLSGLPTIPPHVLHSSAITGRN
ncbi:hypothetical protein FHG87_012168 [Trinorchestia longiramus]|nr:hypothetical protein FHG87_012168 [Trinorchestia longiramus]